MEMTCQEWMVSMNNVSHDEYMRALEKKCEELWPKQEPNLDVEMPSLYKSCKNCKHCDLQPQEEPCKRCCHCVGDGKLDDLWVQKIELSERKLTHEEKEIIGNAWSDPGEGYEFCGRHDAEEYRCWLGDEKWTPWALIKMHMDVKSCVYQFRRRVKQEPTLDEALNPAFSKEELAELEPAEEIKDIQSRTRQCVCGHVWVGGPANVDENCPKCNPEQEPAEAWEDVDLFQKQDGLLYFRHDRYVYMLSGAVNLPGFIGHVYEDGAVRPIPRFDNGGMLPAEIPVAVRMRKEQ